MTAVDLVRMVGAHLACRQVTGSSGAPSCTGRQLQLPLPRQRPQPSSWRVAGKQRC